MVIPDAPAYKCDMCGALEYDHAFLSQIQYTLEQLNLPPEPTPPIQRPSLRNRRPVWQPPRKA